MAATYKKKKKGSFLQQQKKCLKRGSYGKGRELSEEEYHYYIQILEQLSHVECEEKEILIKNFFKEIQKEDQIKMLVTSQIVSRILDDTLPLAPVSDVIAIGNVFLQDLRIFCLDPFASHVLQTLLTLSFRLCQDKPCCTIENSDQNDEDPKKSDEKSKVVLESPEQKKDMETFIFKTSKFVYNNLAEFVLDPYGSHVICSVLEVSSGIDVSDKIKSSKKLQMAHSLLEDRKQILVVPDEQKGLMGEFGDRLAQLPNFTDVICSECGSVVLQTGLLVLSGLKDEHRTSKLVNYIVEHGFKKLRNEYEDDSAIHPVFEWNSCVRLMEVLLTTSSQTEREKLFEFFFRDQMKEVVRHQMGNFAVQKLLLSWKVQDSFVDLYNSVKENLNDAYWEGHTGVLYAFVQACQKLGFHQTKCLKRIRNLLGVEEIECEEGTFCCLLMYFLPLEEYKRRLQAKDLPPLSYHGTLILQEFLVFKNPISVVRCLLSMPYYKLVKMACDPRGSHVFDVFTTSPYIGAANREKLIRRLQGHFATLACSRHGSRSLEAMWATAGVNTRTEICQELVERSSTLKENRYGVMIYHKFLLKHFTKQEKNDWRVLQEKDIKKKQFLKQLLQESEELTTEQPSSKKIKIQNCFAFYNLRLLQNGNIRR